MDRKKFICKCGKEPNYGISYYKEGGMRDYWIGSCCDGGSGMGCCSVENPQYCPYCGNKLPKAKKIKE